ncbi:hypothetical protein ILYODFUR_007746 [Ilyodon furcidens]|uniref:Uncharacterized protein n=1 Tax=Ilyodon furcidens TaxID=33524 RepID=A0ABV0T652_9TELE
MQLVRVRVKTLNFRHTRNYYHSSFFHGTNVDMCEREQKDGTEGERRMGIEIIAGVIINLCSLISEARRIDENLNVTLLASHRRQEIGKSPCFPTPTGSHISSSKL